jgi:uncharacterized phage-associated protein
MRLIKHIIGLLHKRGMTMATVHDVAAYILAKLGPMTAMKLQKLAYYSQAWALVWDEKPLYPERIEAWAMGPVSPDLYNGHRGMYMVAGLEKGDRSVFSADERETLDAVLKFYGDKSSQWLSDLTHQEAPWLNARKDVPQGEFCDNEITQAAMAEYYSALPQK